MPRCLWRLSRGRPWAGLQVRRPFGSDARVARCSKPLPPPPPATAPSLTSQPASPCPSSLAGPLTAASSLGSTEAFSGKDSDGQPAVFAVGVELAGAPLATLPALPAYADCAAACRLNATCSSFMYCGAQVRNPYSLGKVSCCSAALSRRRRQPFARIRGAALH